MLMHSAASSDISKIERELLDRKRGAALVCASVAIVRNNLEEEQEACHLSHKWTCEYQDLSGSIRRTTLLLVFGIFHGGQLAATTLNEDPMITEIIPTITDKVMLLTISPHVILSHFWGTELLTNHVINRRPRRK
jgi:hypothetical protein